MNPNNGKQDINCGVHSCKYNDKVSHCTLQDIVVGSGKTIGDARTKRDTECVSFESEV